MMPDFAQTLASSLGLALVALAYGLRVGARQARGRPLSAKELFRDFLVLHAIGIGLFALIWLVPVGLAPSYVRLSMIRPLANLALWPIALWYGFALPLRLARHLSRRPAVVDAPHPLDGTWPQAESFLDRINTHRAPAPAPGGPAAARSATRPSSPALDRVARLQPVEPRPGDAAR